MRGELESHKTGPKVEYVLYLHAGTAAQPRAVPDDLWVSAGVLVYF